MKRLFHFSLVAVLATACHSDDAAVPAVTGLAGTWKLVNRQCYCVPGPTPDETVTFTATGVSFYKNGQLVSSGTYAPTPVTTCGSQTTVPGLRFTYTTTSNPGPADAAVTLTSNTLILDHGGPCDAPVDTYVPVP